MNNQAILLNPAFKGNEEICKSSRVLSTEGKGIFV